jgi:aspartyl-tRNA synthetase
MGEMEKTSENKISNMTSIEQLDALLTFMNHDDRASDTHDKFRKHFGDKISDKQLDLIIERLFKDFYISDKPVWELNQQTGKYDIPTAKKVYAITLDGKIFIENGGYNRKQKDDAIEVSLDKWTTFALIFGGVAAGIFYTGKGLLLLWAWVGIDCH